MTSPTNLTSSIQVSEEMLPCPNPWCDDGIYDIEQHEGGFFRVGCTCGVAGPANTSEAEAIKLWNVRSKDHSIAVDDVREWKPHLDYAGEPMREGEFRDPPPIGDDVRLDQGKIAEIIAHSMGRYPTDDPVLDATVAVIAYVNGPRLRTLSTGGKK